MHDIVIRGGSIIDGSGAPAFTGDVAIAGGRIAAVGGKQGPARREIDADVPARAVSEHDKEGVWLFRVRRFGNQQVECMTVQSLR